MWPESGGDFACYACRLIPCSFRQISELYRHFHGFISSVSVRKPAPTCRLDIGREDSESMIDIDGVLEALQDRVNILLRSYASESKATRVADIIFTSADSDQMNW